MLLINGERAPSDRCMEVVFVITNNSGARFTKPS